MAKVLLTGASGGFGRLALSSLLKNGHSVAACMRGIETKNKDRADEFREWGAHVVELDVTSDASTESGIKKAITLLQDLDVVINNAGVGVLGLQETFTAADWQRFLT